MMPILKWTRLDRSLDNIRMQKMRTTWNQYSINMLIKVKTREVMIMVLRWWPRRRLKMLAWTFSWNGMTFQNRTLENIWMKSSMQHGRKLTLTTKVSLKKLKLSNSWDSSWVPSPVSLMVLTQVKWNCLDKLQKMNETTNLLCQKKL